MIMKSLKETGENYLEACFELQDSQGIIRSVDIANKMGVSRASVNKAIGILKQDGFVEKEHYGKIRLTEKGKEYAKEVMVKHSILKLFLTKVLDVEEQTADIDACRIEHVVSPETITKLTAYLTNLLK